MFFVIHAFLIQLLNAWEEREHSSTKDICMGLEHGGVMVNRNGRIFNFEQNVPLRVRERMENGCINLNYDCL